MGHEMRISELTAEIVATRDHIARIGRLLFDRRLTDAGGGNISCRVGDVVCITPKHSGMKHQWQLEPDHVLVMDMNGAILHGSGEVSRETKVHLGLHREYGPYGTAVIHAHPHNLMVFAAMTRPMPPVLEATRKFGAIPVIDYAPAHSRKLADNVVASMRGRESQIEKHAAGTIAPWHGLFLMGKDLDAAFDAVERLDTNAYCILMGALLSQSDLLEQTRRVMEDTITSFRE
jgi:L-fuculose-phosphate aldolase